MNVLLKPFIAVYHGLKAIGRLPKKLFHKTEESIEKAENAKAIKENTVKSNPSNENQGKVENQEKTPENKNSQANNSATDKKEEEENARPMIKYRYVVINAMGKKENGTFEAESEAEVRNFLASQDYEIVSVKVRPAYDIDINDYAKIRVSDLSFALTQLSTYIKSGIPLVDAVKILAKQSTKPATKKSFQRLVYELLKGENLSSAMEKQKNVYPKLLINMVKTAEMTGELPETLDDMEEYFSEIEATRKAMVTAMLYPTIIFVIAIGVGTFIMLYVVPKFVEIYNSMDNAKIPGITLAVLAVSNFLQKYIIYIGISVVVILVLCIYLYKNVKSFRRTIQWTLMHLPVFGDVIIYKEVTTFSKTFSSLLSHNVFITDSMEILDKVTNNEIYRSLIYDAINNIAQGKSISSAFKDQWAFPIPAYEMIVTGERTGQLPEMMNKIALYYQDLHKNSVTRIKTFVEPALIILLTVMVGIIVLSIVVPMFSMYGQIQA